MSEKHIVRGIMAGVVGGLVASWVMNEFIAGPGKALTKAVNTPKENRELAQQNPDDQQDATMKVADTLTEVATGGQHLTWSQQKSGGPVVHYSFGALMGGLYGGLAESSDVFTSGYGTGFGSALFTGADLLAVPALHLGPSPLEQPAHAQVPHFAAHLVYGATVELVRRLVRRVL